MSIEMEIVIDTGKDDYEVDMKSSLDTFQGISNTVRKVTESIIDERLQQKLFHTSPVRTKLMKSFKGSYGIKFKIEFLDDQVQQRYKKLGKKTIVQLYQYFICESLFIEPPELSEKSKKVLEVLAEKSNNLIENIRSYNLDGIHTVTNNFGFDVTVRLVNSGAKRTNIIIFNQETSNVIAVEKDTKIDSIRAIITRFNTFTGNGRLLIEGEKNTMSFGFPQNYKYVPQGIKNKISDNLGINNGKDEENYSFINFEVTKIRTKSGVIVKYLISGITK